MSQEIIESDEKQAYVGRFSRWEHIDKIVCKLMDGEDHLSFSSLKAFIKSPKDFIDYKMGDVEEKPQMEYGKMLHCLVLEPDQFDTRYFPLDDTSIIEEIGGAKPRGTNKYKEWVVTQETEANGRIMVKTADYELAKKVAHNVKFNRASSTILMLAPVREQLIEWTYMDFKWKGFIDGKGERIRFDLKSMQDARNRKAQREISENLFYLQQAMYKIGDNGAKDDDTYIIAVDKKGVSVQEIHKRFMEYGADLYQRAVSKFQHCILKDRWYDSYDFHADRFDGIYVADKPAWL